MKKVIIYIISILLILSSGFFIYQILSSESPDLQGPTLHQDANTNKPIPPTPSTQKEKYIPPSPTPDLQTYACGAGGVCNSYQDPVAADCPITFKDRHCENKCGDPSFRCRF